MRRKTSRAEEFDRFSLGNIDTYQCEYERKRQKILNRFAISILGTVLVGAAGFVYTEKQETDIGRSFEVAGTVREMETTLENLRYERRNITPVTLPYQPPRLRTSLETVFLNPEKRISALDEVIKGVEEDVINIRKSDEYKKYLSLLSTKDSQEHFWMIGTLAVMGLLVGIVSYKFYKIGKELDGKINSTAQSHRFS